MGEGRCTHIHTHTHAHDQTHRVCKHTGDNLTENTAYLLGENCGGGKGVISLLTSRPMGYLNFCK